MRALETRVHGLELAMDEISYDLAVSNWRMRVTVQMRVTVEAETTVLSFPPGSFY